MAVGGLAASLSDGDNPSGVTVGQYDHDARQSGFGGALPHFAKKNLEPELFHFISS